MNGCFSFASPSHKRHGGHRGYKDEYSNHTDEEELYNKIATEDKKTQTLEMSSKSSKETSVDDEEDCEEIAQVEEMLKRRKSVSVDKSAKLQELLLEMRDKISKSQMEIIKLKSDVVLRDETITNMKAAASAADIEYNENISGFTLMVEQLEKDVSMHVIRQNKVALAETHLHDKEINELRTKNKELATQSLLHQKEKAALRNIVTGASVVSDHKLESFVEANIILRKSNSFNRDKFSARKSPRAALPINCISLSSVQSPKGDSRIIPTKINALLSAPSAPSVQVPFMSPKKLPPYRSYTRDQ